MLNTRANLAIAASVLAITHASAACAQEQPAPAAQTDPTQPADSVTASEPATGNDIIVTASRRNEKLRDVPSAVTALDGEMLTRIGVQDFQGYASLVPGLSLRDFGAPGLGTVIIRGLNSGSQQLTNTSATYIDDTPFTASGFLSAGALVAPDPDVADLSRIEVLKGPQGTLYGANSLGGLIRIVSSRPDASGASGKIYVEGSTIDGGNQGYAVRGSLNLPIVSDTLALRVNGVYRRTPGFVDNVATGERNVNQSTIKGGRASLRWTPSSALTVDLSGLYQDIDNDGAAAQDNVSGTLTPLYGRYKYSSLLTGASQIKYRLGSGTVNYDFGPVALVGTASYAQYRTTLNSDYSTSYLPYLRIASPLYAAVLPANGNVGGVIRPDLNKFTAEARLISKRLGPIEFVAGGFYTSEHNTYGTYITAYGPTGVPLTGNFITGVPLANLLIATTLSNYQEEAGFINGTLYLSDNFDLGGGVRYAHNSQFAQTGGPNANSFYIPRKTTSFNFSDNVTTYLGTARWRPTSNVSLYLRAASGYRPGGPQTNSAPPAGAQTFIRPDATWNYEGGVKATLLGGQFTIDASVYHIDWTDIQLNTLAGGTVLGANGGDAKVDGFELEMVARPTRLLTVSANVGYTDPRMSRVDAGVQAYLGVQTGDKLPLTPDWTVAMIADQIIPMGDVLKGSLGATLRFRSDMPSSFPGSTTDPSIKIPSLTTLDLRAGLSFGKYSVQLRAENVTNAFGYNTVSTPRLYAGQSVPTGGSVNRPRTFALAVTAGF